MPGLALAVAAGTALLAPTSTRAAIQYFTDLGGPFTWNNATTADWSNVSGGSPAGTYNVAWSAYNDAIFEGTGGTVNVNSSNANSLTFNAAGYTLTGSTIGMGSPSGGTTITVNSNYTDTINSAFSHAGGTTNWNKAGTGTLNYGGSDTTTSVISIQGGTLNFTTGANVSISGEINVASSSNVAALTISGGTITTGTFATSDFNSAGVQNATVTQTGGSLTTGAWYTANWGGTTVLNFSGGTVTATSTDNHLGVRGNTTLNISNAAVVTLPGLIFGHSGGNAVTNTLNLGDGANFTSGTSGILVIGASGISLGKGTGNFDFNGGTLKASAADATFMTGLTSATVDTSGGIIDNGGFAITIGQALTHNALGSSPDGGLTFQGGGTTTLTNADSFTGTTKVTAGTLALGNNLALQNSPIDTSGAGVITITGFTTPTFGGLVNGTGAQNLATVITTGYSSVTALTLNPGTGVTDSYSGAIANGAANMTLTKSGLGTQILSGANSYTGATSITGGILQAGSTTALGNTTSGLSISAGATFDLNGNNITIGSLSTVAGTITDSSTTAVLKISNSLGGGNNTLITGTLGVQIGNGNGNNNTLLTNAANTFSGGAYLGIGSGNQARVTLAGTTIGTGTPGALTSGVLGIGTINIGNATTDQGQFYITGGTNIVNNAVTYNSVLGTDVVAAVRLDGGTNTFAGIQTAGLSAINIGSYGGGTLTITGQLTGSGTFTGTITNSTGNLGGGTVIGTAAGLIVGANANATSTVILNNASANNNYTGDTYITAKGILQTNAANQLPGGATAGNVYLNGTFNMQGNSQAIGELSGSGALDGISGTPILTIGGNNATGLTFSGTIKNTAGTLALTKVGTGTETLSGANTFTGNTNVSAGTLALGNNLALQNSAIDTSGAGVITVTGFTTPTIGGLVNGTGAQNLATVITTGYSSVTALTLNPGTGITDSYSGAIANGAANMTLTKSGAGTQVLSGANSYSGATSITGGTLQAGTSAALGNTTSSLSISGGATFDLHGNNITVGSLPTGTGTITDSSTAALLIISGSLGGGNNTLITGTTSLQIGNGNNTILLTNAANTYSNGTYLGIGGGNAARLQPAANQVIGSGTPGALTSGIFGTGTIYIGAATTDQGQIYLSNAGITINNAITYNSQLGTDVGGAFRVDAANAATLAGIQTAGLTGIVFSSLGAGSLTITGQITGSGTFTGLASAGTGPHGTGYTITNAGLVVGSTNGAITTLILNNGLANNNYTGDTYVTASGVLQTNAANQLPNGATAGNVYLNGTFNMQGTSQSINGLSGSGTLDGVNGTPTLTIGGNNATGLTFSGTIKNTAGTLSLLKVGTGTETLSGTDTFSGSTKVSAGTLTLGSNLALQNSSIDTSGAGVITLSVTTPTIGGLIGSTNLASVMTTGYSGVTALTLNLGTGVTDSYSGAIVNGAAGMTLTKNGAGTQTLSGVNTYSGITTLNAGTLNINNNSALGSNYLAITNNATIDNTSLGAVSLSNIPNVTGGFNLTFNGSNPLTFSNGINLLSGTVTITTSGSSALTIGGILNNSAATNAAGTSNGGGGQALTKAGTGTLTISGASIFGGTKTINLTAGTLNVNNNGALQSFGGNGNNTLNISANTTLDNTSGSTVTIAATVAGVNSGLGTENWNGNFTFGGTYPLIMNAAVVLGADDMVTVNGSALITQTGGITGTHNLTIGGPGNFTESGAIATTTGSVTMSGTGIVTLSGPNTYTGGTTINTGTVKIGNATALGGNAGAASVTAGAVLDLSGTTMTGTNALTLNGTGISGGGALTNSSATAGTYAGLVALGSSGVSIVSSSGNIILNNAGTIIGSGDNLTLDGTAAGSSIASIIGTGAGTLTKNGAGTWALSGASTYTGATAINAGTLLLSGAGAINSSSGITLNGASAAFVQTSTVASTPAVTLTLGKIDGTGTVGNVTVADSTSNIVAAGNGGTGILTIGSLNFSGAGALNFSNTSTMSVGTLFTNGTTAGSILINSTNATWNPGFTPLLGYTTYNGANFTDFAVGTLSGKTANQTMSVVNSGTQIGLQVAGQKSGVVFWGAAKTILADTDVLNVGSAGYAYDLNNAVTTVNGVTFAAGNSTTSLGGNVTMSGFSGGGDNTNTFSSPTGLSAAYSVLTTGAAWGNPATVTVTLNNLTSGHVYASQTWVDDSRAGFLSRTEAASSTGGNPVTLGFTNSNSAGGAGQYSIGGFTAGGTSQSFTLLGNAVTQLNAIQLRDVTGVWSGATNGTWDNGSAATANLNFTGSNNFFTVKQTLGVSAVYFADTDGFGNAVTNNTITVGTGGVSTGTVNFQNNAVNYTFNSADANGITGATALVESGTGTVTLSGTNTYTGGTTINAGTLTIGTAGTLGATTGTLAVNNTNSTAAGTAVVLNLSTTAATTTGSLSGTIATPTSGTNSATINNGGQSFTVNQATPGTYAGVIAGSGSFTLGSSSTSTLTLSGANIYSGGTTVAAGTLKIGSATALGASAGAVSLTAGAVLDLNGQTMTNTNALTLNGTGLGAGALVNSSATAGTYAGLLALGSASSIVSGNGNIILSNTGTIIGSGNNLTLDGTAAGSSIASIIGTGAGTVIKNGAGKWTLSGASTYTGGTTVNVGTLLVGASSTPATGTVISGPLGTGALTLNGGTLSESGGFAIGNNIVANSGTSSNITIAGSNFALNGTLSSSSNAGTAIVNLSNSGGAASIVLSGDPSGFYGTINVNNTNMNLLAANASTSFANASIVFPNAVNSGFGFDLNPTTPANGTTQVGALSSSGAGTGYVYGADPGFTETLQVGALNTSTTYAGVLANFQGTLALTKVGTGTLTLTGANTYGGATTVSTGTLAFSGAQTSNLSTAMSIAGGAILNYAVASGVRDENTVTYTGTGTLLKTGAGTLKWGTGVGTFNLGAGSLIDVQAGTLDAGSNANDVWASNLSSLNVALGAAISELAYLPSQFDALTGAGTVSLDSGAGAGPHNFTIGANNDAAGTYNTAGTANFTGAITSGGNLIKTGTGTQTLSGPDTYSGSTSITGGMLVAGTSAALGNTTSSLSISGGATFDLHGNNITVGSLSTGTGTITDSSTAAILKISGSLGGGNATLITGTTGVQIGNGNSTILLTNAANTFSGGAYLGIGGGNAARLQPVTNQIIGSGTPGALTSGIFGTGTIYIGAATTDQGQIYLSNAGITINNAITYNSQLGTDVGGAFRVDAANAATLAGTQTAGLTGIVFSSLGAGSVTITGQITGSGTFTGLASAGTGPHGTGYTIGTNAGLVVGSTNGAVTTLNLNNASANNNYTGDTYVTASGILQTNAANQLPNGATAGNVVLNGTFNLQGNSQSINGLSGSGTLDGVNGTPTLTVGNNNATGAADTFTGIIKNSGGTLALTKAGSGTLTLSGVNSYGGVTTINGGTLQINSAGSLGSGSYGANIVNNGTLLEYSSTAAQTFSGAISGSGALTKDTGTLNTLTLTNTNSYGGATTINAGKLLLSGTGAINSSSGITLNGASASLVQTSTVASTPTVTLTLGKIDGTGTLGGVTVADSSSNIVAAGNGGTGILTLGSLTFSGAGVVSLPSGSTLSVGTLLTNGTTAGSIPINASRTTWNAGNTTLIGYTPTTGYNGVNFTDFTLGTITGLTSNQTNLGLVNTGSAIALVVAGQKSGVITWGAAKTILADTDVMNVGSATYAYDLNNAVTTVNGVTFAAGNSTTSLGGNVTMSGFSGGGDNTNTFSNPTGLSAAYSVLTTGAAWGNAATVTVTLNNLASGHVYAAQAWVDDSRAGFVTRTDAASSANGNTITLAFTNSNSAGGAGQYSIGGFTAGSAAQSFTLLGNSVTQLNAIQLRDVSGVWSGATTSTWDNGSAATANLNFTGSNNFFNVKSLGVSTLYFADTDGFGNAVTNNTVTVGIGGVSTGTINFVNNTVAYTFTSADANGITGSTALNKTGAAAVTLAGVNTFIGAITLGAGTLQIGSTGSLGSGSYAGNIANTGTLEYSSSAAQTLSGNISGTGALTKDTSATGTLTLTGTNSYSGVTTINAGTLQFANEVSLYNNTPASWTPARITVGAGGTLALNVGGAGQFTTADVTTLLDASHLGGGSATTGFLTGSSLGLDTTAGNVAYTGVIANPTSGQTRGLTKLGANTLTLTNVNTYSGGTTVAAGTLQLFGSGTLGNTSGSLTVNTGGTLDLQGTSQFVGNFAGTGGTVLNSTPSTTSTLTIGVGNASGGFFAGVIQDNTGTGGAVALAKTGSGSLTLSGSNTYSGGTTVNQGVLTGATNSFGRGNITINPIGGSATLSSTGSIAATANLIVNTNAGFTGTMQFQDLTPTIATLNGNGNVQLLGQAVGVGTALTITGGGTFTGVISDNGLGIGGVASLNVAGGTLKLSGASTYSGGTNVSAGTLLVNGPAVAGVSSPTGLGPVTVTGGRLGGTGTIGNGTGFGSSPVAINGGTLSPGPDAANATVGTLYTGDQTWFATLNGSSTYNFKVAGENTGSSLTAAGVESAGTPNQDFVDVNGVLNIDTITNGNGGTFTLAITGNASPLNINSEFIIARAQTIEVNGTPMSPGAYLTNDFTVTEPTGSTYDQVTIQTDAGAGGGLDVVVTPEPGSLGLLGVASLGLLRRRRTNRRCV